MSQFFNLIKFMFSYYHQIDHNQCPASYFLKALIVLVARKAKLKLVSSMLAVFFTTSQTFQWISKLLIRSSLFDLYILLTVAISDSDFFTPSKWTGWKKHMNQNLGILFEKFHRPNKNNNFINLLFNKNNFVSNLMLYLALL